MSKTSPRRITKPGRLLLTAAMSTGILVGGASSVAASEGCGEISATFDGVRLLNDGFGNAAGPFAIDVPAGTYDITMTSWDHHDLYHQPEQENEQWYFTLDSGYTSGVSIDVPTDELTSTTMFAAQEIEASTSITLHHLGESNVNSVEPTCVGFTLVPPPEPENEANDVPVEAEPAVDEVAETPDPDEGIETEVEGIVELPSQTVEILPPAASMTRAPSAVESAQVAQAPAPTLALTGSSTTVTVALLGALFAALGAVFMWMASSASPRRRAVVENS